MLFRSLIHHLRTLINCDLNHILTSTLQLPGDEYPLADPADVEDELGKQVDLILLSGHRELDETTVVDLSSGDGPEVIREGAGPVDAIY